MNSSFTADYIWGVQTSGISGSIRDTDSDFPKAIPIKQALKQFLNSQIRTWKPDLLIVLERKGTAVLRSLMESDNPIEWNWENVLSSKVLEQVPSRLAGKRILVFDDMMKGGAHLKRLVQHLKELGVDVSSPDQVRVAVFAVHEESSAGQAVEGTNIPHAWYRRGLTTPDYTKIRTEIVEMMQQSGSLMLDTEHLEVRVNVIGSFDKFVKALRRSGKVTVFRSASSRSNITVLYEDDTIHLLPREDFPEGTKTESIVKKCRVVQRSGNEFALIPICFPAIPAGHLWNCSHEVASLLGRSVQTSDASDTARFYGVGLRAALSVLRWVLRDLYAAAPREFTVSLPANPKDLRHGRGYHLAHLQVMYPTLDVDYLNKWIAKIEHEAQSESRLLHRQGGPLPSPLLGEDELYERAIGLLQVITDVLDRKRVSLYWRSGVYPTAHPFGLTAAEIFAIGQRFGWEQAITSTLFDVLIDQATLVTHVQTLSDTRNQKTVERTFEPDGEIVSGIVRRYTAQWGLPDVIF